MVTHALVSSDTRTLEQIAQQVAQGLAYAQVQDKDVFVQTPVSFPSGRLVGVQIVGGPDTFTVTDAGAAMREAEFLGAEDLFRREARRVAAEFDLTFNNWELFEAQAPLNQLVECAAAVANAASLSMIRTADKFALRFDVRRREELSIRLARIYGAARVAKDVEISGASAKPWKFDAQVILPSGRPGLFSLVTPAPISVAFAYSKLDDVSRLDLPPFLAAVLDGTFEPGDRALLARAARKIISVNDNDDVFRLAA